MRNVPSFVVCLVFLLVSPPVGCRYPTGCVSAEGESKCVNEELEEQVMNAFPLVNQDSRTSQKAESLMVKLQGRCVVCGGFQRFSAACGYFPSEIWSLLCGAVQSSVN